METPYEKLGHTASYTFTTLQPHPKIGHAWQAGINFSSYASLLGTASDLVKLCTLALLSEEPYVSPIVGNNRIDLAGILELALQLMPQNEAEFLDEARAVFGETAVPATGLPDGNYSAVRVMG